MKNTFFTIFFCWQLISLSAQDDLVSKISQWITRSEFQQADSYLDSILKVSPNDIDANMMKGNLILNRQLSKSFPLLFISNEDESVYSADVTQLKNPPQIVDSFTKIEVEKYWEKALQIDPKRLDLWMGLCTLYGMSNDRESLIATLPKVTALNTKGDEFAFNLAEYARLLKERNNLLGSYAVYEKLISLFPKNDDLKADLAAEYLNNTEFAKAKKILDELSAKGNKNALYLLEDYYVTMGESANALQTIQKIQKQFPLKEFSYYQGIYSFSKGDTIYKKHFTDYIKQFAVPADSNIFYGIADFICLKDFKWNIENFMRFISSPMDRFSSLCILQKGLNDFKQSHIPPLLFSEFLVYEKNYSKAIQLMEKTFPLSMDTISKEERNFFYAYSLYRANENEKSKLAWEKLQNNSEPFKSQSAYYFLSKIALRQNKKTEAKQLLEQLKKMKPTTKYSQLGELMLVQWKD